MNERKKRFPQVLLLGNGLNRLGNSVDWKELIKKIFSNKKADINDTALFDIPYPLLAVLATDGCVNNAINSHIELFAGLSKDELNRINEPICDLLSMGFDDILTTNYSYELEQAACPKITRDGNGCQKLMRHTSPVSRAEGRYLLHTYNEVQYNGRDNRIWHIHGEARKPSTIILGHYNYGALLRRMQEVIGSRENMQYCLEAQGKPPIMESWLDAFIMGDVYILGFGFDFSEFDLWWLLDRKQREKASHGTVRFYSPSAGNEIKFMLLETYGVKTECFGFQKQKPDYAAFYKEAINDIRARINNAQ